MFSQTTLATLGCNLFTAPFVKLFQEIIFVKRWLPLSPKHVNSHIWASARTNFESSMVHNTCLPDFKMATKIYASRPTGCSDPVLKTKERDCPSETWSVSFHIFQCERTSGGGRVFHTITIYFQQFEAN